MKKKNIAALKYEGKKSLNFRSTALVLDEADDVAIFSLLAPIKYRKKVAKN